MAGDCREREEGPSGLRTIEDLAREKNGAPWIGFLHRSVRGQHREGEEKLLERDNQIKGGEREISVGG